MHTEGTGSFENAIAQAWVDELRAHGLPAIDAALRATEIDGGRIGQHDGQRAVAAAEAVATLLGRAGPTVPEAVHAWAAAQPPLDDHALAALASRAREAVGWASEMETSMLPDRWCDRWYGRPSAECDAWIAAIVDLERRLA